MFLKVQFRTLWFHPIQKGSSTFLIGRFRSFKVLSSKEGFLHRTLRFHPIHKKGSSMLPATPKNEVLNFDTL